jgi:hypothetical protein
VTDLFGQVVFAVGGAEYRWEDLVIAAHLWGDWGRLRDRVGEGLACLQQLDDEDHALAAEIESAANEFRYARDLIAAQEIEEWLERWGLTADEWMDYIGATVLRRIWSAELANLVTEYQPSEEDVDARIKTEGICSGEFARLAHDLAGRAAIHDRTRHETVAEVDADKDAIDILAEFPSRLKIGGLPGVSMEATQANIERIASLESSYRRFRQRVVTVEAVDAQLRSHHTDWTRLDCQIIAFPEEEAVREAALCVREDGRSLDDVAAETNTMTRREPIYIEDIEPGFQDQFLAAQRGDFVGPLARGDEFTLYLVLDKVRPSRNDARVAARAEEAIMRRLVDHEINDLVKWRYRF